MKNLKSLFVILLFTLISNSDSYSSVESVIGIPICISAGEPELFASTSSVNHDEADGTIICWLDSKMNGSLFVQKIDIHGSLLWSQKGTVLDKNLGSGFTSESDYPLIFSDNEGGAVVIYRKQAITREDIFVQKVNSRGMKIHRPVCLSSKSDGYNYSPEAVLTHNNEIAVVWENFRAGEFNIFLQKVDMNCKKCLNNGDGIMVCDFEYDQRKPTIACDDQDNMYIVWLDSRNSSNAAGYSFDLYANVFDRDGKYPEYGNEGRLIPLNGENEVRTNSISVYDNMSDPQIRKEMFFSHRIISAGKGSIILAAEKTDNTGNSNVRIMSLNAALDFVWSKDIDTGGKQLHPIMKAYDNQNVLLIWNDERNKQSEVYSTIINEDGTVKWGGKSGKNISCDNIKSSFTRVLPSERNKNGIHIFQNSAFLAWYTPQTNKLFLKQFILADESGTCDKATEIQDEISNGEHTSITSQGRDLVIVYKHFNNLFAIIRDVSGLKTTGPDDKIEIGNFPNPFNPSTEIQFSIPEDGFVSLSVYDITGKLVRTLVNEFRRGGRHQVSFNAENLSSGVYFYKLETNEYVTTKKMTLIR